MESEEIGDGLTEAETRRLRDHVRLVPADLTAAKLDQIAEMLDLLDVFLRSITSGKARILSEDGTSEVFQDEDAEALVGDDMQRDLRRWAAFMRERESR